MAIKIVSLLFLCLVAGIFSAEEKPMEEAPTAVKGVEAKEEMKTSADLESANSYVYYGLGYSPYAYGYGYGYYPRYYRYHPYSYSYSSYPYYSTYYTSFYGSPYTFHSFI